jgi:hypothetical protein
MVPVAPDSTTKRIRIKHLLTAPLAVLPEEVVQSHTEMLAPTGMLYRGSPLIGLCIGTVGVYPDGEETRYRALALPIPPPFLRADFAMALRSHSFGEDRRITMDLDLLYAWVAQLNILSGASTNDLPEISRRNSVQTWKIIMDSRVDCNRSSTVFLQDTPCKSSAYYSRYPYIGSE